MGRGGTCTKRHFLPSKSSLPPLNTPAVHSSTHGLPRCTPGLLRPGPLPPAPRASQLRGARMRTPETQAPHAPPPGTGPLLHCPGGAPGPFPRLLGPARPHPPPEIASPATPGRSREPASGAKGPETRGARSPGRRRGSGEAEEGKGEIRQRRHFLRPWPTRNPGVRRRVAELGR